MQGDRRRHVRAREAEATKVTVAQETTKVTVAQEATKQAQELTKTTVAQEATNQATSPAAFGQSKS